MKFWLHKCKCPNHWQKQSSVRIKAWEPVSVMALTVFPEITTLSYGLPPQNQILESWHWSEQQWGLKMCWLNWTPSSNMTWSRTFCTVDRSGLPWNVQLALTLTVAKSAEKTFDHSYRFQPAETGKSGQMFFPQIFNWNIQQLRYSTIEQHCSVSVHLVDAAYPFHQLEAEK